MSLLTCKQFLQELNDYLDPSIDPETKRHLGKPRQQVPQLLRDRGHHAENSSGL